MLGSITARKSWTRARVSAREELACATWGMVFPSSKTSRTVLTLNPSVKLRRGRFCRFPSSMVDTVSLSHLVSTERINSK